MNKFILTATLLLLSVVAGAQEHRTHVADALDAASHQLSNAEKQLSTHLQYYDARYFYHTGQLAEVNIRSNGASAIFHIAEAQDIISTILAALPNAEADELQDFRRDINQPFVTNSERSLLLHIAIAQDYASKLAGSHILDPNHGTVKPSANVNSALHNLQQAWRESDFAAWHINDAIYQEVHGVN